MAVHIGKIIYWNGSFGFISYGMESLFFHRSSLVHKEIHLLDKVSFNIELNKHGKHKGKKNAISIKLTGEAVNLNEYNRFMGVLKNWDEKRGVIISPQQKQPIHFIATRKLYLDDTFQKNDLVVFCPVKSTKHENVLFTLFAYNINREFDISFLQKQAVESGNEKIIQYIDQLAKSKVLSVDEKFIIKLSRLQYVDNQASYTALVSLLKEYYGLNHDLLFEALRKICSDTYLIQLFESGIIESYDLELMKTYFHNSTADNKRNLIRKFQHTDEKIILIHHIHLLRAKGQLEFLNDDLKTVLDIVGRDQNTRHIEIYTALKTELRSKLFANDLILLWLSDYFDTLSEAFLVAHFDIKNTQLLRKLVEKEGAKFEKARKIIFENYFLNFKNANFENELGLLIKTLKEFERTYQLRYEEIISIYNSIFDNYQKFLLWIFGVKQIYFDLNSIAKRKEPINDYFKIKYILRCHSEKTTRHLFTVKNEISYEGLRQFITTNPWNDFLYPITSDEDEYNNINSFMLDVYRFFDEGSIDFKQLANDIFEAMPKYNKHHIRLWLYNWVENERYDYIGFRPGFKELTKEEQKAFRERGTDLIKGELIDKISNEVIPCKNIIDSSPIETVYSAYLFNFFFEEGKLRLRKEDGSYTKIHEEGLSSRTFNDIPVSNRLNKLNIIVTVDNENKISKIDGLELIFDTIHTKQIEKILGKAIETDIIGVSKGNNYIEDFNLIKDIKDYLFANQVENVDIKLVNEPKNFYRRLDDTSGIDKYEMTALFTHNAPFDFGIVWDNVDYSQDRAIYVFKSNSLELENQLLKLSDAIAKTAQFRSTLISSAEDEMHQLFRANLGYVGTIRKDKGDLHSFDKFQSKLDRLFTLPTPILPSKEEQKALGNWDPETPHSVRVKSTSSGHSPKTQPRQMKEDEIGRVDIPFFEKNETIVKNVPLIEKNEPIDKSVQDQRKIRIYNLLKSLNEIADKIYTV